jgi:predicted TIM-barrel fold metal-dependent hydrolase
MKRLILLGALALVLVLGALAAVPSIRHSLGLRGPEPSRVEAAQAPAGRGGQLGPGQIRPRPAEGREPEFPAPSIRDYHPRSTLVVPEHPVPRAKFPVVDFHGHPPNLNSPAAINQLVETMDPLNLRLMINANGASGERLTQSLEAIRASNFKDRFAMFTQLNLRDVGPGSGAKIAQQLEADVKAGALGVGEIMKSFGLTIKKTDGSRLKLDDPELEPVWDAAARLNIPVFIHVADPAEFFQPLDYQNERWLELALYPDRRYQDRSRFPDFETLMGERDRMIARHPKTTWVLAHLGWHAQNLARLGAIFDKNPNVYAEVGAVLYDIGRQPHTAHDFFVKYQDRLLFGKDSYQPDEYPYYWRVFETNDEYFDYYRDYHAFWKMYGIGLPDPVLRKLYYGNAMKIVPNLPRAGFPAN